MALKDIKEKYNCDKIALFYDDKNNDIYCLINDNKFEVINENEEKIGHLYYEKVNQDLIYLRNIEVKEEYQSKKIGSKLLDLFEEIIVKDGDKKVYGIFEPKNNKASRFYKHKGYSFLKMDKHIDKNYKLNFSSFNQISFIEKDDVILYKKVVKKNIENYEEYDDFFLPKKTEIIKKM